MTYVRFAAVVIKRTALPNVCSIDSYQTLLRIHVVLFVVLSFFYSSVDVVMRGRSAFPAPLKFRPYGAISISLLLLLLLLLTFACNLSEPAREKRTWSASSCKTCLNRRFRPFVSLYTVGRRAFPVSGAIVWNDLPLHVASAPSLAVFSQRLETFLFSRSYQDYITWLVCYYHHSSLLSGHLWSLQ